MGSDIIMCQKKYDSKLCQDSPMYIQLDLFEDSETTLLRFEVAELKKAQHSLRRGLFGRYDKLQSKLDNLTLEYDRLRAILQRMGIPQESSGLDRVLNDCVVSF